MKKIILSLMVIAGCAFGQVVNPTVEEDPYWVAVSNDVMTKANNGQTAFDWGNHATNGYLKTETDPKWSAVSNLVFRADGSVLPTAVWNFNQKSITNMDNLSVDSITIGGYTITGAQTYTESDPVWSAVSNSITIKANNGQTAFGWGNHAAAGYVSYSGVTNHLIPTVSNQFDLGSTNKPFKHGYFNTSISDYMTSYDNKCNIIMNSSNFIMRFNGFDAIDIKNRALNGEWFLNMGLLSATNSIVNLDNLQRQAKLSSIVAPSPVAGYVLKTDGNTNYWALLEDESGGGGGDNSCVGAVLYAEGITNDLSGGNVASIINLVKIGANKIVNINGETMFDFEHSEIKYGSAFDGWTVYGKFYRYGDNILPVIDFDDKKAYLGRIYDGFDGDYVIDFTNQELLVSSMNPGWSCDGVFRVDDICSYDNAPMINVKNGILMDGDNKKIFSWLNRKVYESDGETVAWYWDNSGFVVTNNSFVVSGGGSTPLLNVDYSSGKVIISDGEKQSIDASSRVLMDTNENFSVDWKNRQLRSSRNSVEIDWDLLKLGSGYSWIFCCNVLPEAPSNFTLGGPMHWWDKSYVTVQYVSNSIVDSSNYLVLSTSGRYLCDNDGHLVFDFNNSDSKYKLGAQNGLYDLELYGTKITAKTNVTINGNLTISGSAIYKKKVITVTDNYSVGITNSNAVIVMNSASEKTISLPSVSASDVGITYTFVKVNSGKLIIDAADSDTIADSSAGGTIYNDVSSETYATVTLILATETKWVIVGMDGTWTTN